MPLVVVEADLPEGHDAVMGPTAAGHWRGSLLPGDTIVAALDAGAVLELRGAGEHAEVAATRRVWLRIAVPEKLPLV
eukprot:10683859-Lingulodinium_polyedra.AAC.1